MASLESTITGLMGTKRHVDNDTNHVSKSSISELLTPGSDSVSTNPLGVTHQKSTYLDTTRGKESSCGISSLSIWNTYSTEPSISAPPYSAVEARSMIQKVLSHGNKLSEQKREAFQSALGSLSESLKSSFLDASSLSSNAESLLRTQEWIDNPAIPDVEVIQVSAPI